MAGPTISLSLANFITIGLIAMLFAWLFNLARKQFGF